MSSIELRKGAENQYVRQSDHNRVTLITVAITVNQTKPSVDTVY
ncbi:hypothetical protein T12_13388 [Trichinella patagoniensis]|uniref:Uncharacterized protein n=1 Tax=Trichinella patagoniensis TaxID=990121 RepID=A0A0V0YPV3_9BILA|nr:hypothetical protein T12_13388 [Trichinella patagoniensis]